MYASPYQALKAYSQVGVESGVAAADPHKLILMLFEGASVAIANAKRHMQAKEVKQKCEAISKASLIIDGGLKASLDLNVGGELARNLADLYDYMEQRLIIANLKNDISILDEVAKLLSELHQAWEAIGKTSAANPDVPGKIEASV
jgi:flagellar protein FliS